LRFAIPTLIISDVISFSGNRLSLLGILEITLHDDIEFLVTFVFTAWPELACMLSKLKFFE